MTRISDSFHARTPIFAPALLLLATLLAAPVAAQDTSVADLPETKLATVETTAKVGPESTGLVAATEPAAVSMDFLREGTDPVSLDQLKAMEGPMREVAERVFAATVNIQMGGSQGTGVIVTEDGYVLTAAHVIGRPNHPASVVLSDGRRFRATSLGVNRDVDSGMLKIELPDDFGQMLPWVDLGQSGDLKPGAWLMAIGHPGGLDEKRGMVIRAGRLVFSNPGLMRTDCTLVGGDSGGPLVDMDGYLIGIHSRIGQRLWENIHVPIDTFSEDWDRLMAGEIIGGSNSPHLGLSLRGDSNEIESVERWEAAEKAGLKRNDRILKIDDSEITSRRDLSRALRKVKPGQTVEMVVERAGAKLTLQLKVGRQ